MLQKIFLIKRLGLIIVCIFRLDINDHRSYPIPWIDPRSWKTSLRRETFKQK